MGGRLRIAWLIAMAVAMGLAGPGALSPATAQISVPLPGSDPKPKVVQRKRYVPPTAPNRNPNRIANVFAETNTSNRKLTDAEAAGAAGMPSSASAEVEVAVKAKTDDTAPVETAALSEEGSGAVEADTPEAVEDSADDSAASDAGTNADDSSEAQDVEDTKQASEPQEESASTDATADSDGDSEESAVSGEAEAEPDDSLEPEAPEVAEAETAASGETEVVDARSTEPDDAEIADTKESEPEPVDVAEAPEDDDAPAEQAAEANETDAPQTSDEETATADASATEPTDTESAEAEETVETAPEPIETAAVEPEPAEESESAEVPESAAQASTGTVDTDKAEAEPETAPEHEASVILEVSPPPEEIVVASVAPADEETTSDDDAPKAAEEEAPSDEDEPKTAEEEKPSDEGAPQEMAALTPPSEPAPADSASEDDAPAAAETEPASDEDETPVADEDEMPAADADDAVAAEDAAESESSEAAETSASDDAAITEAEETAEETVAAPPPPTPAHPIVATVRSQLADPDLGKSVAASDLEALKAFYGVHEGPPLWVTEEGFTPKAQAIIAEIEKADEWGLDAESFELPPPNDLLATSNAHADDELQLSIAILSYARAAQIGRMSPGKASKLFDQHPSLRDPKTVLTELAEANDPSAYLVSLHPQHDQFKRLRAALAEARATAEATGRDPRNDPQVQRIVINMERWRWMPRSLGSFHVWNNIPEFKARAIKNGKIIYAEKTIVGEFKYATPFFSAPMRNIVFHPNWTVPPTIVKEDLAPKLEQGGGGGLFGGGGPAAALRRHGLSVSLGGQPVDANRVDWRNENIHRYTFTQEPGPANVLGTLKFNFPNKHAIYMHDTIEPELFGRTVRTLSHGCIRVHQPDRFAALLLGEDKGWSYGQVRGLLAKNQTSVISLSRHIPVHLTYFTVVVDEHGTLNTFDDAYGIDNRMAASLFKNPASFHVPAPPPEIADTGPRTRDQRRRSSGGGLDGIISGLFGN